MSLEIFREKLYQHIISFWTPAYPTYPVEFENHKFDQPLGPWVDVQIEDAIESYRKTIGLDYALDKKGVVTIAVMVPEDVGVKLLYEMIDVMDDNISEQNWRLSDGDRVTFRNMISKRRGISDGYYFINLLFFYTRRECRHIT